MPEEEAQTIPDSRRRRSILTSAMGELAPQGWDEATAAVVLEEFSFTSMFVLRALEPVKDLNKALKEVLGADLPEQPNTVAAGDNDTRIFWLREGQWMVHAPASLHMKLHNGLDKALGDIESSAVDVGDGHILLRLSGARASATVRKNCPLDIHPRAFPDGSMALTRIGQADVLIHFVRNDGDAHPVFDIIVRATFAEYLVRLLYDAALEYGIHLKSAA